MRKTFRSVPVLCSLVFIAACEDAATLQKQSMGEQTQSNTQVINERSEPSSVAVGDHGEVADRPAFAVADAGPEAQAAPLEADTKRGAAKDFVKEQKEYMQTMQSRLIEVDRSIAALDAKTQRAAGQKHVDKYARLKKARAQREALASSIKALETERAGTWDASRSRLDREWTALKALLDAN